MSLIKATGYVLYASADVCCQVLKTQKGFMIANDFFGDGLQYAHKLVKVHHDWKQLNTFIKQLNIAHPFITKCASGVLTWHSTISLVRKSGLSKKWKLGQCLFKTTSKTLSLLKTFDQHGTHCIDTLIQWDATLCGGLAARLGKSALFHTFGMNTLKGLTNQLSILSTLCAIGQAIQEYSETTKVPLPYAQASPFELRKRHYAKRVLAISLSKNMLKIVSRLCVGSTLLPYITVTLLVVNVSQEVFKIYYLGTNQKAPRMVPLPQYLQDAFL